MTDQADVRCRKAMMKVSLPLWLVTIHSVMILFFMFALYRHWFLSDVPFDCFYKPFLYISGPFVYFVAHYLQHLSEKFFSPAQIMVCWNIVPGGLCLILGGVQWWLVGRFWLWYRARGYRRTKRPSLGMVRRARTRWEGRWGRPSLHNRLSEVSNIAT